jgi:hypothetical protein
VEAPIIVNSILKPAEFSEILSLVNSVRLHPFILDWNTTFQRYAFRDLHQLDFWHDLVTLRLNQKFNLNLSKTFNYTSWYSSKGICPEHSDTEECEIVLNLCVKQVGKWDFFILNKPYHIRPQESILYKGEWSHYRHQSELSEETCLIAFCFRMSSRGTGG